MKIRRRLWAALFGLCMVFALVQPGMAGAASGASLTLNYGYPNVKFQIYQVADEEKRLTEPFAGYDISLDHNTNAEWQELAMELEDGVEKDQISPTRETSTGSDGKVQFSGLEAGWYLVTGSRMKLSGTEYKAVPFVVNLTEGVPMKADVKHSPVPDEPETPTDPTPEEPTNPGGSDDGGGSSGGSDGGSGGPGGPGESTSITDQDVPLGPGSGEPETAAVPDEEVPLAKLPQTGQLWWPVPLLFAGGCLLIVGGMIQGKGETSAHER